MVQGEYDGLIVGFNKRLNHRFTVRAMPTPETDNQLGINSLPSDSFIGRHLVSSTEAGYQDQFERSAVRTNGRLCNRRICSLMVLIKPRSI